MTIQENLKHLASLLTTDEQKEFMDTIDDQLGDMQEDAENLTEENKEYSREVRDLKDRIRELESAVEYSNECDLGIGKISWTSDSYELGELIELLCDKTKATSTKRVMSLLNAL